MSESSKDNPVTPPQRNWLFILIVPAVVIVLGLGYAGGYFILPGSVRSAYQSGDCKAVLSRSDFYSSVYPMAKGTDTADLVRECAVFTLAVNRKTEELWRDSYDAFGVYTETYPQGLFADEAHQHSAVVLMGLANEEAGKNDYSKADDNLDHILEFYGDTSTAVDAEILKSDLRMALGEELRGIGDFAGAEQVFKEIDIWARENNRTEEARASQLELAQTYLAWGLELLSQGNFAEAKAKLDAVLSTDPDPSSNSGPAAKADASQADLYTQWGDHLIAQKDFANAMERYETAATLSGTNDPSAANDIIANGYLQWAAELTDAEDFFGALVLLDFAQESAGSDSTKNLVDDARADLYVAFSNSDGEQARKAMGDAVRIVCEHHIPPSLPIFGLVEDDIRAGVHGAEDPLPESVVAKTPASLHYVACIEEDTRLVGTLTLPISTTQFGGGPGVTQVTYANFQYIWNVVLRKIDGQEAATTIVEGVEPAALIPFNIDVTTFNYFGAKPEVSDLADWILTVIK